MTFSDIVTEVMDRLGYTSGSSQVRVGRAVNRLYRSVTTSIGLHHARHTNTSMAVTVGNPEVTFTACERLERVWLVNDSGVPTVLSEVPFSRLRESIAGDSDNPSCYAVKSTTASSVTIRLDKTPETAYTLYADKIVEIGDLSGTDEPAFSESFHDLLIEGVLKDEYKKQEKLQLARDSQAEYERRVSDLRMWMAKSAYMDIYQGIYSTDSQLRTGIGGGSNTPTTSSTNAAELNDLSAAEIILLAQILG